MNCSQEKLAIELPDGRRLIVPLAWYPWLQHSSQAERRNWQLLGEGYALDWPDIDEHIGLEASWRVADVARARRPLNR